VVIVFHAIWPFLARWWIADNEPAETKWNQDGIFLKHDTPAAESAVTLCENSPPAEEDKSRFVLHSFQEGTARTCSPML